MALAAATASVTIRAVTGVIASDTASPCHRHSKMNPLRKWRRRAGRKSKRLRKGGWNGITSWKGAFVNMSDNRARGPQAQECDVSQPRIVFPREAIQLVDFEKGGVIRNAGRVVRRQWHALSARGVGGRTTRRTAEGRSRTRCEWRICGARGRVDG